MPTDRLCEVALAATATQATKFARRQARICSNADEKQRNTRKAAVMIQKGLFKQSLPRFLSESRPSCSYYPMEAKKGLR